MVWVSSGFSKRFGRRASTSASTKAGTSKLFGDSPPPQSETSQFRSTSRCAAAKMYARWLVANYRGDPTVSNPQTGSSSTTR
jgi:GDP-D-mannose dehydratase